MKKKSKYISFFEIVNSTLLINSKFYTTEKYIYAWDGVPLKKIAFTLFIQLLLF